MGISGILFCYNFLFVWRMRKKKKAEGGIGTDNLGSLFYFIFCKWPFWDFFVLESTPVRLSSLKSSAVGSTLYLFILIKTPGISFIITKQKRLVFRCREYLLQ